MLRCDSTCIGLKRLNYLASRSSPRSPRRKKQRSKFGLVRLGRYAVPQGHIEDSSFRRYGWILNQVEPELQNEDYLAVGAIDVAFYRDLLILQTSDLPVATLHETWYVCLVVRVAPKLVLAGAPCTYYVLDSCRAVVPDISVNAHSCLTYGESVLGNTRMMNYYCVYTSTDSFTIWNSGLEARRRQFGQVRQH